MAGRATWSRHTEQRVSEYVKQEQTSAGSEQGRQVLRACLSRTDGLDGSGGDFSGERGQDKWYSTTIKESRFFNFYFLK